MKLKINAFTIPELLIFLTIVGVISVFMMTIIKPGEKYLPYAYYTVYNALAEAAFNIKQDALDTSSGDKNGTAKPEDKVFPGVKADANNKTEAQAAARELCKKLAIDPDSDPDNAASGFQYGYINTTEYFCSAANFKPLSLSSNVTENDLNTKMAFRGTNSMRFYISEMGSISVPDNMNGGTPQTIKYFVVWVDLNGDRRPNITAWTEKKPADIIPFIITTSGTVIPAGAPILDPRYTTVRIQYPSGSNLKYSVESLTFLDAQVRAYDKREFPSYELYSISNSRYTDGTNGKVLYTSEEFDTKRTAIINGSKVDDHCKVDNGEPPQCTLILDENIKY